MELNMFSRQRFRRTCLSALEKYYNNPELMVDRKGKMYYSIWRTEQHLLEVFCDSSGTVTVYQYVEASF